MSEDLGDSWSGHGKQNQLVLNLGIPTTEVQLPMTPEEAVREVGKAERNVVQVFGDAAGHELVCGECQSCRRGCGHE